MTGERIGRYELVREIGEGGMGTVWLARQSEPVVREVALKIIKLGMDTKEVVARFEAERQALALMDHPYIAKVLDGGATEEGRPYFVMELVDGEPITSFCDSARLDLRARLELFTKVCEAVQHAHQKGIIHRDLKPSNVLVSERDGVADPKVIDFGIAKATNAELTQHTMLTQHAQILGTPEYMAPEQAELSGLDIDTRADVYSLGVLLYHLLTGTKPFDVESVLESGYDELLRTIREVDPARPSTRVSGLDESTSSIGTSRRVDLPTLGRHLRGDLDWIVMKAIEKDRSRRYETANGLAADVRRYLAQEPVLAAPPSAAYRFRKFVRRRKKTVAAVAVIAVVLVAGSIGTGIGWWNTVEANRKLGVALGEKDEALAGEMRERERAQENAERALAAEQEANDEAERATRAEREARTRADELEQVASFQAGQLAGLDVELMGSRLRRSILAAAPEPRRDELERDLASVNFTSLALRTLEENLFDRTREAIDAQFSDQPLVQARLFDTLGVVQGNLGLLDSALEPLERSLALLRAELGADHPDTLAAMRHLGVLYHKVGELDRAELLLRDVLEGSRRVLGEEDEETLIAMGSLGQVLQARGALDEAEVLFTESLEARRRPGAEEDQSILEDMNRLGTLLFYQGKWGESARLSREVLESARRTLGDDAELTLTVLGNLAGTLIYLDEGDEAEVLLREQLASYRRLLGDEHPLTIGTLNVLALCLNNLRRWSEAEPYYRESYELAARVLGADHPDTLLYQGNLAGWFRDAGRPEEAEALYRDILARTRSLLGDGHLDTLRWLRNLGDVRADLGDFAEAEALYHEAYDNAVFALGEDHPATYAAEWRIAEVSLRLGRVAEAEEIFRRMVESQRRSLGPRHTETLSTMFDLIQVLIEQDKLNEAEPFALELVEGRRAQQGDDHYLTGQAMRLLAALHELQGRHEEALELRRETLELFRRVLPPDDPDLLDVERQVERPLGR